ncbi:MAG: glycosyltransferase family 4 protein [Rhodothermales bacterium]|nr:glycosyltransferase family 4 protein [Rhodothermales bacterium]
MKQPHLMVHLGFLGDGRNYHVQRWLPALSRQGLQVTLFTFRPPENGMDGVTVIPLRPPVARIRGRLSLLDFWFSGRQVRHALQEHDVDVLMASYATHYGWTGTLSRFHPVIIQTWTFDVSTYPVSGWQRFVFGPQVSAVLERADLITTDGDALSDYVRANYADVRAEVVPVRWGIDTDEIDHARESIAFRKQNNIPADAPVVVSSRGLNPVYRPMVALQALLALLENDSSVHVVVLTLEHDRDQETRDLLSRIINHQRGHVVDRFLSRTEMSELWASTDVVVSVPSTDGISEGVLEAMYAGAIPVLSDIPSNRTFLKDSVNGYFVTGDDENELASQLETIVAELKSIREGIRARNIQWVREEASLKGTAEYVARLIKGLAKKE